MRIPGRNQRDDGDNGDPLDGVIDPLHAPGTAGAVFRPDLRPVFEPFTALLVGGLGLLGLLRGVGSLLALHAIAVIRAYEQRVDAETQAALDSTNDLLRLYVGIAGPVQLTTMIAFLGWQYLLARSSSVDPRALRRPPRWHVLAYFTPILALWWPAQNIRDVYAGALATRWPTGQAPRVGRLPTFILGWWGLRLITILLTHFALVFSVTAVGPVQTRQTLGLLAVAFAAGLPAALAAAYVVVRVTTTAGGQVRLRLRT